MTEPQEFDVEVFGLKIRIQGKGTYTKQDGTKGEKRDGITLSGNGTYMPLTALQLAGILQLFQAGTDARKELVRRIQIEQSAVMALPTK